MASRRPTLTGLDRLISTTRPEGIRVEMDYDEDGNLILHIDGRTQTWWFERDGFGPLRETIDPLGNRTVFDVDANGNVVKTSTFAADGQLLAEQEVVFDERDRVEKELAWLWEYPVPAAGESERPAAARALETVYEYDDNSNLTRVTDPRGFVTAFAYDTAGRLFRTTDALGNVTELDLDRAGRATSTDAIEQQQGGGPVTVTTSATYDAFGRPKTTTDARELYLNKPGGGYVRLDAYDDVSGEIVSRKFSQLARVQEKTALGYLEELATKYPSGARIADVPSSGSLAGSAIYGRQILEIPIQTHPVSTSVLQRARRLGITIRDVAGKVYE